MKKKILYGLIGASASFFIYLLVLQIIKLMNIFNSPEGFDLLPALFCVVIFVVLLCHAGFIVLLMDKKQANYVVEDEENWWERWDQV